ncbi:MAG: mandelate racemase/muconate lactonizing enzyme family protein [Acidobacteriia bacterium]|nr:mandelate racemase/muconate lactonizing enzyme family protein [Terriglobia bacterium]
MTQITRRELLQSISALGAAGTTLHGLAAAAPLEVASMRITGFELLPVRIPMAERLREAWNASWSNQQRNQTHFTPVFVRLHTDAGVSGLGEAKMERSKAEVTLKSMIGRSPWEFVQDDAINGILIAIYDLIGNATGLPVARLLAPRPAERIIQTWWSQCFPPDMMASEAKMGLTQGYRVHKIKIRPWQDPIDQLNAISAVVPKEFKIWADANSWWAKDNPWKDKSIWAGSVDGALHVLRRLSTFPNLMGIESPFARQEFQPYRQLRGKVPLRIAEHIDGSDPMSYIREGLLDAFITGAPRLGSYFTQLAAVGKAAGVPLWVEHSIDNGIGQVFQAHQAAALPGVEYCISITHCLEDDCMKEPFTMDNGYFHIPRKPGLGVSLDEAAVDKYRIK